MPARASSPAFHARLDLGPYGGKTKSVQDARIDEMTQRHASSRLSSCPRARRSSDALTVFDRVRPACRSAWFTVSLMVSVPSSTRAAFKASSSMSTRCFAIRLVYTTAPGIYTPGPHSYGRAKRPTRLDVKRPRHTATSDEESNIHSCREGDSHPNPTRLGRWPVRNRRVGVRMMRRTTSGTTPATTPGATTSVRVARSRQ